MDSRYLIPKERFPIRHLLLFGWMPGPLKRWVYRSLLGYRVGRGVRLGFGCAIVGRDVEIEGHVELGFFSILRGQTIRIGRHAHIGALSCLMCRRIEIGEDAKINEQVFVGGPDLPESVFHLGCRTTVMQYSFINPTKPVVIGDDSGIGGHCLIFTHGSWLSALEGYPVKFEGVTIGESVWLPWRVFVMPGTTIGDGSVIGANSLVQGDIPARSLAAGSPAKVLKTAPDFPKVVSWEERRSIIQEIVEEFDRFVSSLGIERDGNGFYSTRGGRFRLVRWRERVGETAMLSRGDVVLSEVEISGELAERLRVVGADWLDLASKSRCTEGNPLCEELALFITRYGIRLRRHVV